MAQDNQNPETSQQDLQQQEQSEQGSQSPPKPQAPEDHYYKRQFEKADKRIKELERASMTESQRLAAERDELAKANAALSVELQDSRMSRKFETVAKAAGIIDSEVAYLLGKDRLTMTDDGKLMGAEQFIKDLKQTRPHLFASGGAMGSGGGNKQQAEPSKTPGESLARWVRQHR